MGEGTPAQRLRPDSLYQPHPLADAAMLRCKLAKASLLGEGSGEGRVPQFIAPSDSNSGTIGAAGKTLLAYMKG